MIVILLLALIIPAVLLRAWVISWLWLWFIVPLGAPVIGMAWAVGISSFTALFTASASTSKETDAVEALARGAMLLFVSPLISLGIGWIAHLAMA